MRPIPAILALAAFASVNSAQAHGDEPQRLDKLRWILGDWSQATNKSTTRESWTEKSGVFKGQGTVTSNGDGKVRSRESLLLVEMGGEIFYLAKVKQNAMPVPFKMTSSSATHAVFENKDHDFPKRVEYRLTNEDKLNVKVSDGGQRGFVINFQKLDQAKKKSGG